MATNLTPTSSFSFKLKTFDGSNKEVVLSAGSVLFVVGANGTGKSSILQQINQQHHGKCIRIIAHRQTWFSTNELNITPARKKQLESQMASQDSQSNSRWMDHIGETRSSLALYNLVEAENTTARKIAQLVRDKDAVSALEMAEAPSPIQEINALFAISSIQVRLELQEADGQVLAKKNGSPGYSVAQLSDGERNALLIAAEILTAKPGSLIIVDEPERHLHRSIISPMLTALFLRRPDCAFVISTHEVMLPVDHPLSQKMLVRGCRNDPADVTSWDFDIVEPSVDIAGMLDEQLAVDLLGARRRVLFVEGTNASLDKAVYSILFGDASVVAKGNCRDVEQAVMGIRASAGLHWVKAFGIVDNDNRPAAELTELRRCGVYAVPYYSVESLYYHPEIQKRVSVRRQTALGGDCAKRLAAAKEAVLTAAVLVADRFALTVAERRVREELMAKIPKKSDFAAPNPINIEVKTNDQLAKARAEFDALVAGNDDGKILCAYPVRESGALAGVAKALGFQGRSEYEEAVRKLLIDDQGAREFLVGLFGSLAADLKES